MSLDLYMIGLIVRDMSASLEFYRQLGVAIPEGSEERTHVEIKMAGMTFFLDSRPTRWDPAFVQPGAAEQTGPRDSYPSILEFYLKQRSAVEAIYQKLIHLGYDGFRSPYETSFGMRFAMIKDPDGNTILLSGDL